MERIGVSGVNCLSGSARKSGAIFREGSPMAENLKVSDIIPAPPERVYSAWLDPKEHARMTGAIATDEGDGRFSAWDGYITGRTVSSVPHSKIVQAWRTTEFPSDLPDSVLTISFAKVDGGTKVTVVHEELPEGQSEAYALGWDEHYFAPMKAFFGSPMEQVREVSERITQQFEAATEDAMRVVEDARTSARKQAVKAVQAVKKVQKRASAQLKAVGQKVQALVKGAQKKAKKPAAKKKAVSKVALKKVPKPAVKKKVAKKIAKKKSRR
ncbi:MAG: SRPBCC domain-containing protein [Archangium sp.]|nr:SRPBCC domain-containing protein [Archangium sp.]